MSTSRDKPQTPTEQESVELDRFRRAALKRGAMRSAKFKDSIEDAIRVIAEEMASNGGIYPHNGGAVNIIEVVRRAGVNEATVYKKTNAATKLRIDKWLETLSKKETVGRMRVRRAYRERSEDWRQKYLALETSHIATSLQNQQLQAENLKLKQTNEGLVAELGRYSAAKVVPLASKEPR